MDCSRPRSATMASGSIASRRSSASGILAAGEAATVEAPTGEAAGKPAGPDVVGCVGEGWHPEATRQAATTGASQRAFIETRKRYRRPGCRRCAPARPGNSLVTWRLALRRRRSKLTEARLELATQAPLVVAFKPARLHAVQRHRGDLVERQALGRRHGSVLNAQVEVGHARVVRVDRCHEAGLAHRPD